VVPVAYSPLLAPYVTLETPISKQNPNLLESVLITELAAKYKRTAAQILLNWGLQVGTGVIPKTNQHARLSENFESWTFTLED
jgi:diketogulonate reductase-like aldo/keto reductase